MWAELNRNINNTSKTIVIAEDNCSERLRLTAIVSKLGHQVLEASDGAEALAFVESQSVDMVISDWRMPNMSGFELCQNIRSDWDYPPYIILLTGQNTVLDLAAAMDAGADDFIAKPFAGEELRARINAGLRLIEGRQTLANQNSELMSSLARESTILDQLRIDLASAEKLQRSTLSIPKALPGGLRLLHYFRGATGVNGDAYSVIPLTDSVVGFYLIDISGHGVRAAMLSFYATQMLSGSLLWRQDPESGRRIPETPSRLVSRLNALFLRQFNGREYMTMIYGTINVETGIGMLCQAGHPAPVICPSSDDPSPFQVLGGGGFPVGILEQATFRDYPFELKIGERFIVSSDGLIDCYYEQGLPMSLGHVAALLDRLKAAGQENLQPRWEASLNDILDRQKQTDDVSVLVIERHSPSSSIRPPGAASESTFSDLR
ncbi:PP2C family protein-serine/threonine phosphatase [Marinobacter sp. CA1]|uniref:PP2C family protein-serine/threonine phosphatase n=1 Tax=Marinobacter sp. CA1 TaxID=2817656 RepID=UPI001D05F383|nr:SpoIIE family protein phosphatase [Marinobacter sp. CA1]UDL07039.1 SpoIIE family protein phosphatase [Marinobacter sp. CA1]